MSDWPRFVDDAFTRLKKTFMAGGDVSAVTIEEPEDGGGNTDSDTGESVPGIGGDVAGKVGEATDSEHSPQHAEQPAGEQQLPQA